MIHLNTHITMKFFIFLTWFFLAGLFGLQPAQAQDTGLQGVNLYNNRMAIDAFGFLDVNSPTLAKKGQWFLKIKEDFCANHILNLNVGGVTQDIVESALTTNFLVSRSLTDFLTVALDVPVHFWLQERNVTTAQEFTTSAVGDMHLATKFRLVKEGKIRPGLALLGSLTLPSGDEGKFVGDNFSVPTLELIVGKDLHYVNILLNVGAAFPEQTTVAGIDFDDRVNAALGLSTPLYFIDESWVLLAEVHGSFQPKGIQTNTSPLAIVGGVKKTFGKGWQIEAAAGGSLTNAAGNERIRTFISLGYTPN